MRKQERPTIKRSGLIDNSMRATSPNNENIKAAIIILLKGVLFSFANKNAQAISVGINNGLVMYIKLALLV